MMLGCDHGKFFMAEFEGWVNSFLANLGLVVSSQQVFNVMTQSSTPC